MNPNFLFLNKGDGTFEDATESSGAAYDEKGQAQSGMGVDAEDVNGDGLPELFVTNFANEYNTLYHEPGQGHVHGRDPLLRPGRRHHAVGRLGDRAWPTSTTTAGPTTSSPTATSTTTADELGQIVRLRRASAALPQPRGASGSAWRPATPAPTSTPSTSAGARRSATSTTTATSTSSSTTRTRPPALLRNDTKTDNHWIRLDLQGTRSNRDAVGARVEAVIPAEAIGVKPDPKDAANAKSEPSAMTTIYRQRKGGTSMESANDPRVLIGVGQAQEVAKLTVRWPSGAVTTLEHLATNRTHKIVEPK